MPNINDVLASAHSLIEASTELGSHMVWCREPCYMPYVHKMSARRRFILQGIIHRAVLDMLQECSAERLRVRDSKGKWRSDHR